jgi:hypothetical protein
MSDTKIRVVHQDAAGTMLCRMRFSATRGAYHHRGFDPVFPWNLWDGERLIDVATSRKEAEKWLKRQEICTCGVRVNNDGGVIVVPPFNTPHTCGVTS